MKLHEPCLVLQAGQPGSVKLARKQENHKSDIRREDFGFKSKSTPPQCEHMQAFEKEFLDIIANIKFRSVKDAFQKMLKEAISNIKQSPNVFAIADKTGNIYEMPKQQQKLKLLHNNFPKIYKKAQPKLENINKLRSKKNCRAH